MQGRERDTGQEAGDAPLHAAKCQHPDQPEGAPAPVRIGLAATAMHAGALLVHCGKLGFSGEDEDLNVGESIPGLGMTTAGDATGRQGDHISRAWVVGLAQPPEMVDQPPGRSPLPAC